MQSNPYSCLNSIESGRGPVAKVIVTIYYLYSGVRSFVVRAEGLWPVLDSQPSELMFPAELLT